MSNETMFERLNKINVNDKVTIKDTGRTKLTYLSWADAWAEAKKADESVNVKVYENENGLPYFASDEGLMVKVEVTMNKIDHLVYLPVMDGANNSMKLQGYEFETKYGKKIKVKAADMMDINKTIQRAIVKGIALHGLGLYIYAGEDLPEGELPPKEESPVKEVSKSEPEASNSFRKGKAVSKKVEEPEEEDEL